MTTYCHVANGAVDNRAVFDGQIPTDWPDHDNWIASEEAQIGWTYADGVFTAPPAPEEPPPPLPDLLPYQFRAMLVLSGKQGDLDAYIAGLSEPAKTIAQAKLDYSLSFQRDNDLVLQAQQALGLTDAQLDALWEQAAAIT
jgi:hypothetical protein